MRKTFIAALAVIAACALAAPALHAADATPAETRPGTPVAAPAAPPAAPAKPLAVGDAVPAEVVFENMDGVVGPVKFEKKVTALSFFNTSCSACRAELSLLNGLAKQNKDLRVVAVCVDAAGAPSAKRFAEQMKYGFDYLVDKDFKAAERFGISSTPALVLVDGSGKITFKHSGFLNQDEEVIVSKVMGK